MFETNFNVNVDRRSEINFISIAVSLFSLRVLIPPPTHDWSCESLGLPGVSFAVAEWEGSLCSSRLAAMINMGGNEWNKT